LVLGEWVSIALNINNSYDGTDTTPLEFNHLTPRQMSSYMVQMMMRGKSNKINKYRLFSMMKTRIATIVTTRTMISVTTTTMEITAMKRLRVRIAMEMRKA
jgi:hypothetical protein